MRVSERASEESQRELLENTTFDRNQLLRATVDSSQKELLCIRTNNYTTPGIHCSLCAVQSADHWQMTAAAELAVAAAAIAAGAAFANQRSARATKRKTLKKQLQETR